MLSSICLEGLGPSPKLEVEFSPRLSIITGDNGLGKTLLLDVAWYLMTRTWPSAPPRPSRNLSPLMLSGTFSPNPNPGSGSRPLALATSMFDPRLEEWADSGPADRIHKFQGVALYVRIGGSIAVWDPYKHTNHGLSNGTKRDDETVFTEDEIWNGKSGESRSILTGMVSRWLEWQSRNPALFEAFASVLKVLSQGIDEPLVPGEPRRVSLKDDRDFPTLVLPYGTVPITQASAGMKRILSVAYMLVWVWNEHVEAAKLLGKKPVGEFLILVDEIEAHLHPQWQRRILPALMESVGRVSELGSNGHAVKPSLQLITTTHSPLVLASIEEEFDPATDRLITLEIERDNGEVIVTARHTEWQKRGDASAWLQSESLGDTAPVSVEAEEATNAAKAILSEAEPAPEKLRDVHNQLRAVLKDTDPFWPRWLYYLERKGVALT